MSKKYPGGIIRGTPVTPTATSAPGIWTAAKRKPIQNKASGRALPVRLRLVRQQI